MANIVWLLEETLAAIHHRQIAARTFLLLNGVNLDASQDEKVFTFLNLAEGTISEEALADWIRKRIQS